MPGIFKQSIYVLTCCNVVVALLVATITQWMVTNRLNYKAKEFFSDIIPFLAMSLIMVGMVRIVKLLPLNEALILIIQIAVGVATYLILSVLTKNKSFLFLYHYVINKIKKSES